MAAGYTGYHGCEYSMAGGLTEQTSELNAAFACHPFWEQVSAGLWTGLMRPLLSCQCSFGYEPAKELAFTASPSNVFACTCESAEFHLLQDQDCPVASNAVPRIRNLYFPVCHKLSRIGAQMVWCTSDPSTMSETWGT